MLSFFSYKSTIRSTSLFNDSSFEGVTILFFCFTQKQVPRQLAKYIFYARGRWMFVCPLKGFKTNGKKNADLCND